MFYHSARSLSGDHSLAEDGTPMGNSMENSEAAIDTDQLAIPGSTHSKEISDNEVFK